ncbi:MAG: hypothetical protein J5544_00350 [Clostridia bacterium]|nr:hypothetical protein [Clostridia bacterium]
MKKLFCIILTAAFVLPLAACAGGKEPAPTAAPGVTAAPGETSGPGGDAYVPDFSYNPETDFDKRFLMNGNVNTLLETEDVYYFLPSGDHFMHWCEKDGSDYGVLCGKPECMHDGGNGEAKNTDCNGYLGMEGKQFSWIADGKIYYMQALPLGRPEGCCRIYRMNLDGTEHEFVRAVPWPETPYGDHMSPQRLIYHRGILYFLIFGGYIEEGEPMQPLMAAALPMDGDEISIMYDSGPVMAFYGELCPVGEFCYIFAWGGSQVTKILRWSSVTEQTELLYEGDELGIIAKFWVDQTGTVYAASKYEEGVGQDAVLRLENGEWEEVLRFDDPDIHYSIRAVSDGIVIARDYREYERDMDRDIDLWIRRFDGETLYKGKLPMAWIGELEEKYGGHVKLEHSMLFCGNENEILAIYETWLPKPLGREYAPTCYVLVRYDITENGLNEVMLCETRHWIIEDLFG